MKARAYVDGFNLYFRALEKYPGLKWLDIRRLLALEFQADAFDKIWYFTAHIKGRTWRHDPDKPQRQKLYLTALRTIPELELVLGSYQTYAEAMDVVTPQEGGPSRVEVWNTVEKRSDVNLATQMIVDAMDGAMEKAVVVSNDSDLIAPIVLLRQRFGLQVAVLSPDRENPNLELKAVASTFQEIRPSALRLSQFPDEVPTPSGGRLRRPSKWQIQSMDWTDQLAAIREKLPPA